MADSVVICLDDIEKIACEKLSRPALDYYRSGANHEITLRDNRAAFHRYKLRPRFLRDVSHRDLRTTLLGQQVQFPIGISPTAMQRMAHPEGELATARAAEAMGTVMILSTIATSSIEEVTSDSPEGNHWFQLYIYKDREITRQLVTRAEASGYKALVLTVDAPVFGLRHRDVFNKFTLPSHLRMANFDVTDQKSYGVKSSHGSGINEYVKSLFDQSLTWDDITWLRSITNIPIIAKGILTGEDALKAVESGVAAIMVSNHGGRQLDCVPAAIDVLEEVVQAVGGRCEVYMDGGVRTGTDVIKALALGARAVFIGRPVIWGLTYNGQEGVEQVLRILKNELDMAMMLSGTTSVTDITRSLVKKDQCSCASKL